MTAMIEAWSFLGPHGPVARDVESCIFMILNTLLECAWATIQARTHVQLALACERSMIRAQHRLRLTMQHVYGHIGNLGDECAGHAAALGTFGLVSSHNVATRWIRNNFDASVMFFDGCNSISDILERLQHIRTDATSLPQNASSCCVHHRFFVFLMCIFVIGDSALSLLFERIHFVLQNKQWKALLRLFLPRRALLNISRKTCGISLLELLFLEETNGH